MTDSDTVVIIPARMASNRLPGKPLADIAGKPMILHVVDRAKEANIGPVYVACGDNEIAHIVRDAGEQAIITDSGIPSGTDRIHQALQTIDPRKQLHKIINVQGDLPTLDPTIIQQTAHILTNPHVDIATIVTPITDDTERQNPHVVKVALAQKPDTTIARALYFSRSCIPANAGEHFHHIGIYGYTRAALDRFVSLPVSPLEKREQLEQLRALENDMRIDVDIAYTTPLGVDTPDDLERARKELTHD